MFRSNTNLGKPTRLQLRSTMVRYIVALVTLGTMTAGSFFIVRSLIVDMKNSESLIAEASEIRSSIHKTMLSVDVVKAERSQHASTAAVAAAEALRSQADQLLTSLTEANLTQSVWEVVRDQNTGLEPNVRMLIESAMAWKAGGPDEAHGTVSAMDEVVPTDPHHKVANHDMGAAMHEGHNPAAMKAIDDLIAQLRADAHQKQDGAALIHDALGFGTLLLLAVEALIIFVPLARTARTEKKRADEATHELEYLASHDALTGLLNRGQIDRVLEVAVKEAASVKQQLGLILLDLDEFKPINDTLGHAAGDAVLRAVAQRISAALRPGDLCGRLGGDEFIVILPDVGNEPDIQQIANAILENLVDPVKFNGLEISAKASVGYAMFPIAGTDAGALIAAADLAMYNAKRNGRGRVSVFSQQMRMEAERSRTIETALQSAFANQEFELHYQTINSGQDNSPTAVEALVRWRHPERGMLGPGEFLEDVRRSGRMKNLTSFVMSEATAQYAVWRAAGYRLGAIHVNIGEDFLKDEDAQRTTVDLLRTRGIDPHELVLEVTDDVRFDDSAVQAALSYLSQQGMTLAVDDFGVGAISIDSLGCPAIKIVKLDRALIHAATSTIGGADVVSSIAFLLRALGKKIVAEGIETEQQREVVHQLGIDLRQGYYYDRPRDATALTAAFANADRLVTGDKNFAA